MKRYIGGIFICWFLVAGLALPVMAAVEPVRKEQSKFLLNDSDELQAAKQQVKVLEAQIQLMREFQGAVLNTVYWALGAVFLLVGLLLGFGWFANFKVYERDKENLKAELEVLFKAKSTEADELIAQKTKKLGGELSARLEEGVIRVEKDLKGEFYKIDRRVFELEYLRLEGKMQKNESDNMALTDALNLLDICMKRDFYKVADTIHFMLKKIDKGGKLTAGEMTRLSIILDELPSQYRGLNEKLVAKLHAAEIFG